MQHSIKVGVTFAATSTVITTLGLMVGLEAGTSSRIAVIGGILTIAVADAIADAFGIHVSEESEDQHTTKEIWTSTAATFVAKVLFTLIFAVPVLLLDNLRSAILVNIGIGAAIIIISSWRMAQQQKKNAWNVIGEHILIMTVAIIATHYLGVWIGRTFS